MKWIPAFALSALVMALSAHASPKLDARAMTIRLMSVTMNSKVLVDRAPKGAPNAGDVVWAKSELRNERPQFGKPKNAIVGSDVATLKYVSASVGDVKVTVKLPGGTIRAAGRVRDGDRGQTIRVTGGTGTFANARGTCTVTTLDPGGLALNVYRLQLP